MNYPFLPFLGGVIILGVTLEIVENYSRNGAVVLFIIFIMGMLIVRPSITTNIQSILGR